jgi:hypothetical protein
MEPERGAVSDALARRWNWGAFLLPWLWPFWHGAPWLGLAALLGIFFAPWIAPAFVTIGVAAYLGLRGGAIAVRSRAYAGDDDYRTVERAWAVAGTIVAVASVPVTIGCIFLGYLIGAMVTPPR